MKKKSIKIGSTKKVEPVAPEPVIPKDVEVVNRGELDMLIKQGFKIIETKSAVLGVRPKTYILRKE